MGTSSLKGQSHEVNNFKVLKIKSELFVYETMFFCILLVEKNTFKVPACFYEHLLILEILPEAESEIPVFLVFTTTLAANRRE
jgi:hypothetical protein